MMVNTILQRIEDDRNPPLFLIPCQNDRNKHESIYMQLSHRAHELIVEPGT